MAVALLTCPAASQQITPKVDVAPDPAADFNTEPSYTIGATDILAVRVWKEPEVSVDSVAVRRDGKITVPLVGEVFALGLTPVQLEDVLEAKFKRYINNPIVTVIPREINSQVIYVIGGVARPGSMRLTPGMSALDAIAQAGGLTDFAKRKKIYVLRDEAGRRVQLPFDYPDVLSGKSLDGDIPLRAGDRLIVPE